MTTFRKLFLDHPASVQETYLEHSRFAFGFSAQLFGAAFAALVHALVPALYEKTASTKVAELYERTRYRGAPVKKKAAEGLAALDN